MICFIAAIVQLVVGFTLVVLNAPSGIIIFGYSNWLLLGGLIACSGIITLLAGSVIGFIAIRKGRDEKSILWLTLNGSFLFGFIVLMSLGLIIQNFEEKNKKERLAKYNAERNESRISDAKKLRNIYFKNVINEKLMVIMTTKIGENLGIMKVGDYTLISLPEASGNGGDKAVEEIMDMAKYFNKLIIRDFLVRGDRDGLIQIIDFYKKNDETFSYRLNDKYVFVKNVDVDLWKNKNEVIEGIEAEMVASGILNK